MAPITHHSNDETHAALLDRLDMQKEPKPFRNPNWKPANRRNKNLRQILADESKARQSMLNSQAQSLQQSAQVSGAVTPMDVDESDANTPAINLDVSKGSHDLSRLVLEKNAARSTLNLPTGANTPGSMAPLNGSINVGPPVTYESLRAAPSLKPKKKYCDITGLPTKYGKDPKTGLYYYNMEIYKHIQTLSTGQIQEYLAIRGANTVLK